MVSFLWRCRSRRIGAPWSRRRRLPLIVPRPSSTLWGFSASPAGRPDSFHSVFLWSGFTSPGLLSYFRFGRTESGARTLRVVLESFCVHSPAHASFYLFWGGSSCLPCLFSLESAFLRGGVHPYHSVLSLWSSSLAGVRLSPALALSSLVVWCSGRTALFLFLLAGAVPAFLPAALSVATLSFSVGPVCSSFSAEACAILCALCWSGQRHGVCCLAGAVFSLLLFYRTSVGPRTLVLPGGGGEGGAAGGLAGRGAMLAPSAVPCGLSCPLSSWLGLEAYCLIWILWRAGFLSFRRETCAPSSCSLCPLSSLLQRAQPSFGFLSLGDWQS